MASSNVQIGWKDHPMSEAGEKDQERRDQGRPDGPDRPGPKDVVPAVTLAAIPLRPFGNGNAFECMEGQVAKGLGLTKLGATYVEVPPGKSASPFHVHHVLDEMFVILAGRGEYRFGANTRSVGAGDVLGAPCGGHEFAHRLTNTGAEPLKYLAISSRSEADVCEYPDSGKFWAGSGADGERFSFVGRQADQRGYWDGETG